jgi:rhodanese-related sulfurtransferase
MDTNFDITVAELKELLESGQPVNLIEEDNLGGTLIPLGDLPDSLEELEALKGQDIYLQCRSGARSQRAKEYLMSEGFDKVHNVIGGIMAYREL